MKLFPKLLIVLVSFLAACSQPSQNGKLKITVFGGAERVSGSLTLIEANNKKILVDCGLYYPDEGDGDYNERQKIADEKNESLPVDAKTIDAVFITHAHLDHIGRISLLLDKGFKGKIYCTSATRKILEEMLFSQARYDNRPRNWVYSKNAIKEGEGENVYTTAHWNNCEWQNKIKTSNEIAFYGKRTEIEESKKIDFSPCKECAKKTVQVIMPAVETFEYSKIFEFDENTKITFFNAGHIPGSASVFLEVNLGKGIVKKLLFSGDLGNSLNLLQNGPNPIPQADAVWMETTYGNTKRSIDAMMEFKRFKQEVADVVKNGGIAWIPAFALDRTQKVLYLISKAKKEGIIPENIPIFCPSPTAANITNIYQSELDKKEGWFKSDLYQESNVFAYHQQKLPKEIPQPSILVTTSGMMDAAFSDNLSQTLLPNALITVFLVGYQDPGTPGGQLKAGQTSVQWDGKQIEVNANVRDFKVFSAHADAQDLEKWLSNQNKQTTKIYLVHGEKSALFAQKKSLENLGFQNVKVPHEGEELDFSQHSK